MQKHSVKQPQGPNSAWWQRHGSAARVPHEGGTNAFNASLFQHDGCKQSAMRDKWPSKQLIARFLSLGHPGGGSIGIQARHAGQQAMANRQGLGLTYVKVVDQDCARIAALVKCSEPKYPAVCRGGTQGQSRI